MMEYMDKNVGKIVDKVKELGIDDKTLILFTGDNGTDRKVFSTFRGKKIKGMKGHTVDAGIHVPLIAYQKGLTRPEINENLIDFTDFLPTFLETAGVETENYLDGKSFYPILNGSEDKIRDWVFCSYAPKWGKFKEARFAMTTKYKLYDDGSFYDFINDPQEEYPITQIDSYNATRDMLQHVLDTMKN